ncbi:MAG: hypothetical protein ACYDAK_04345 [Candidatus Limnocylindrales bacterium]
MSPTDPLAVQAGAGFGGLLLSAFFLGVLHGVTPDEHTWPITLSYAIGAASGRRGMQAGLLFSAAFTVQRAIASELAFLALAPILANGSLDAAIDLVVGVVMAASGAYILWRGRELHLTEWLERLLHRLLRVAEQDETDGQLAMGSSPVPLRMTLVHGFVAGWGTGAFALIIYTRIAPAMPNAGVAFLPGLLFGLGTMLVQAAAGAAIGAWMRSRGLGPAALTYVGRSVAGNTLLFGGLLFTAWGLFALLAPGLATPLERGLPTGLPIPNLDSVNAGLLLVAVIVFGIAAGSFVRATRRVRSLFPAATSHRQEQP